MKRNISISGVLLLAFAFALSSHAQTPSLGEALPKLLSLRDQQTVREGWLKTRRYDAAADDAAKEDRDVDRDQRRVPRRPCHSSYRASTSVRGQARLFRFCGS